MGLGVVEEEAGSIADVRRSGAEDEGATLALAVVVVGGVEEVGAEETMIRGSTGVLEGSDGEDDEGCEGSLATRVSVATAVT